MGFYGHQGKLSQISTYILPGCQHKRLFFRKYDI